jgi:hypothetical protein
MVFVDSHATSSLAASTPEYTITEYFAKSCPHCVRMAPVWKEASSQAAQLPIGNNVAWVQKECYGDNWAPGPDINYCQSKGIEAFPTIQLAKNGSSTVWDAPPLTGATTEQKAEQLLKFVESKVGASVKINGISTDALLLTCGKPQESRRFWEFL